MDNEKKQIVIRDKDNANMIEMKTERGHMKIRAATKLTIQVGDNITLTMNGNNGAVTLECSKLTMKTTGNTTLDAMGSMKVNGANVAIEATSMLKAESSGIASISGSPIKIG